MPNIIPLLNVTYRLSRVHSAGIQTGVYNRVILLNIPFASANTKFVEGFDAREFIFESDRGSHQLRKKTATPYSDYDFDIFRVIGQEVTTTLPQLREWLSITPVQWALKVNEKDFTYFLNVRYGDASTGNDVWAYNSNDGGNNTNIEFFDKDVVRVGRTTNKLCPRDKINAAQPPDTVGEQLVMAREL